MSFRACLGMGLTDKFSSVFEFVNTESKNNDNRLCVRRASSAPEEATPQEAAYLGAS